jgi:hypothetical protein
VLANGEVTGLFLRGNRSGPAVLNQVALAPAGLARPQRRGHGSARLGAACASRRSSWRRPRHNLIQGLNKLFHCHRHGAGGDFLRLFPGQTRAPEFLHGHYDSDDDESQKSDADELAHARAYRSREASMHLYEGKGLDRPLWRGPKFRAPPQGAWRLTGPWALSPMKNPAPGGDARRQRLGLTPSLIGLPRCRSRSFHR